MELFIGISKIKLELLVEQFLTFIFFYPLFSKCLSKIRSIETEKELAFDLKFNEDYLNYVSKQISWQDQRCSEEFLDQLPGNSDFRNRKAYTGYATATTFWFLKNDPNYLINYSFMGSIMDFFVHLLCVDLKHPVTSIQLANSMGYFDMKTNDWSALLDDDKKVKFPKHLLPTVLSDCNHLAGKLKFKFLELNSGIPIFVAYGDLQCAIYSAMFKKEHCAILNSGTSMQLAFPIGLTKAISSTNLSKLFSSKLNLTIDANQTNEMDQLYLDIVPYFNGEYLITSSSLNGGNVITFFIKSIKKFINDLFNDIEINENQIWSRITNLTKDYIRTVNLEDSKDEQMIELNKMPSFNCRLYGERNEKVKSKFSIYSINTNNFELDKLYYSLCSSILDNIFEMCPIDLLKKQQINKLVALGSTIKDNEILRICLEQRIKREQLELIYEKEAESDLGIAMVAYEKFKLTI